MLHGNSTTDDGRTPLQLALESADEPLTRLLVTKGADVNSKFSNGLSPLILTVGNNCVSLARYLLSENADPNHCLSDGRAALHIAAELGADVDIITLLNKAGAITTLGDEHSWTPLHYAAHNGHWTVALMLKEDDKT